MTALSLPARVALLASAALALSTVTALGVTPAGAATLARFCYQGSGYGTTFQAGPAVSSGRSALSTLGCTDQAGIHHTNTASGVSRDKLLTSGTATTAVNSHSSPVRSYTTASTAQVNLLDGLVTGDTITAASVTTHQPGFAVSAAGTRVVHLVVAGRAVTATPAPNTRIELPGFGYLILNQQASRITTTSAALTVNALHLYVTTANSLDVTPNTNVVVSSASSGLAGPVAGVLSGRAYGSSAVSPGKPTINLGRSFPEYLSCLGTGGRTRTNTGASGAVAKLFSTRTIAETARGTVTTTSASGETTSSVQSAYLLSSLVHATEIKADAHVSTTGSTISLSDVGSRFGSLAVRGFPRINAQVAANTIRTVRGVGTLYLRRVLRTAHGIEVRMIELVLTRSVNGLPIGTDIRIAVAGASAPAR